MLLPLFEAIQNHAISTAIRDSIWIYPVIQAFHLVSLTVFIGSVLVVDLRLLGGGFSQQPLAKVARDARPWMLGGFIAMVLTGLPQLVSNALRQYYSVFFWTKMEMILIALLFTIFVRRRFIQGDEAAMDPYWAKVVGITSITLWAGVGIPGRLIGLLS